MGSKKEANQRLRAARDALQELSERERRAGVTEETPEYLAANRAVIDAEPGASWWVRGSW